MAAKSVGNKSVGNTIVISEIASDSIGVCGHGVIEVHDATTGALLDKQVYTNVITNYTRAQLVQAFKGTSVDVGVTHIAVGSDGTAALPTDTALGSEVLRSTPTSIIDYSTMSVGFKLFLSASVGNGTTFREIGLFDDPTAGNMMARSVSFTPIVKNSAITITFTHIITYT